MFIRRTNTSSRKTGQAYHTYRLVEGVRTGNVVKQTTLLNLGTHFDVEQAVWPALAARIDALLRGREGLQLEPLPESVEAIAQRCAAQLIAVRAAEASDASHGAAAAPDAVERFQEVDLDSIEMVRPRTVGVEHAALCAMRRCGFEDKLAELGFNRPQIAAAVGNIVGRMARPGSELATHAWLQKRSALGELLEFDFESMDLNRLYRSSDALYKHRDALQEHLFGAAKSLFGFTFGARESCAGTRWLDASARFLFRRVHWPTAHFLCAAVNRQNRSSKIRRTESRNSIARGAPGFPDFSPHEFVSAPRPATLRQTFKIET